MREMSRDKREKEEEIFQYVSRKAVEKERKKKEKSLGRELLSLLLYFVFVIAISYGIVTFIGQRTQVSGNSMNPTLQHKDNLLIDKISYRFNDPKRFDIIVFEYLEEPGTHYVKRIIGLPGETIQIKDSLIYVNGEVLEEHFGAEAMLMEGIAKDEITLGEDEYFVLGDNRNHSKDSRDELVGAVKKDQIIGKVWIRIWPLSSFGKVDS